MELMMESEFNYIYTNNPMYDEIMDSDTIANEKADKK
jgi:hypothetical protein